MPPSSFALDRVSLKEFPMYENSNLDFVHNVFVMMLRDAAIAYTLNQWW